eukprot:TRINITY_DN12048_c0_g2_i1.p1 TRINITY_DN12048_c0_g2~~TRINITY_DN12048_c0_g2_i1.p1  ORF type:complete len:276 (-),score=44.24 TRINITY_DN12048_c0_g2_i1:281-991(-)
MAGLAISEIKQQGSKVGMEESGTDQCKSTEKKPTLIWSPLWSAFTTDFEEVAPSLLLGFVATSALSAFTVEKTLATAAILKGMKGRLILLSLALPLQFCEHAAVPITAALQKAGASGGLAFAMLTTLPAINVGSAGVIIKIAGLYGATRVIGSIVVTGLALSYLADAMKMRVEQVGHSTEALPEWYVHCSRWVLGVLTIFSIARAVYGKGSAQHHCCSSSSVTCEDVNATSSKKDE